MLRALYTAATGAETQQFHIDVIANNVANVNTTGFKKVRAEFQDLLSQTFATPGAIGAQGTTDPSGIQVGLGAVVSATQRVFLPGSIVQTGNPLDISIQGDGFFQVLLDSGEIAYTRDGTFKRDATGQIVTSDGYPLQPGLTVPNDATEIVIGIDGTVSVRQAGSVQLNDIGQIQLVRFSNPAGLESIGRNLFSQTPASGDPIQGVAGQAEFSRTTVNQGFLENSNVQIVEELINLITAQRAFEANSKVMTASDEMLRTINNVV
ncbi:MAG: flagellar basal-body rod protein FlgG [Candidatus Melainabacteria bacterium]|nr:flagellar basal-body rod protein FlgG [Candidatus Melainabacteria bacterium]